jgi:hypothetical protein
VREISRRVKSRRWRSRLHLGQVRKHSQEGSRLFFFFVRLQTTQCAFLDAHIQSRTLHFINDRRNAKCPTNLCKAEDCHSSIFLIQLVPGYLFRYFIYFQVQDHDKNDTNENDNNKLNSPSPSVIYPCYLRLPQLWLLFWCLSIAD